MRVMQSHLAKGRESWSLGVTIFNDRKDKGKSGVTISASTGNSGNSEPGLLVMTGNAGNMGSADLVETENSRDLGNLGDSLEPAEQEARAAQATTPTQVNKVRKCTHFMATGHQILYPRMIYAGSIVGEVFCNES